MAETSFPVAGGAGVTDAAYERLMAPIMGAGRYAVNPTPTQISTPLVFADSTGRQVKAYANQAAIVRGFRWESGTTPPVVALDANTSGNPRLDLIVLRLDRSTFTVRLGKTNGTPAATPAPPAPIQDAGSTGVWELPVASVRVTSSGTTGQPSIAAGDVTALDYWLAPPSIILRDTVSVPPAVTGQIAHRTDSGRTYRGVGTTWVGFGEQGAMTKLAAAGGWSNDTIYTQRINGLTYLQCYVTLAAAVDKAPNTDLTICTLPAQFRPPVGSFLTPCWVSPGQVGIARVDGTTGILSLTTYPQTFPKGGTLVIGPVCYPSV